MLSKSLAFLFISHFLLAQSAFAQAAPSQPSIISTPPQNVPSEPVICPANLNTTVAAIASRYNLQRHHWGYYVQPLTASSPLASYQGSSLFIPASSNKLLTTAAVLNHLGSQYRLRTSEQ
jgi:serine-type D-Ala-D-Ala carboxypeptidase/endopeptidase (penicillin-binding protein 4)